MRNHNVNEFSSLNELITFQKNYSGNQQEIISNHSILIEQEKSTLNKEIVQLEDFIKTRKNEIEQELFFELEKLKQQLGSLLSSHFNIFNTFTNYLKKIGIKKRIREIELNLNLEIAYSIQESTNTLTKKINRYQYITSHFMDAVKQSSSLQLKELERKKSLIDELNTTIYGALGEQKVSNELENLPDEYILINDFTCSFYPPIYNRKENDYIKSVQIDHILISPAGIFLIETKNWSEHSLNNINLRSPVEQIKRTNFALFKILTGRITNSLDHHHWGERKVPIRNLIVLINQKPREEFQHVKILILKELRNYVEYFKPSFSSKETQIIANFLLSLNRDNFTKTPVPISKSERSIRPSLDSGSMTYSNVDTINKWKTIKLIFGVALIAITITFIDFLRQSFDSSKTANFQYSAQTARINSKKGLHLRDQPSSRGKILLTIPFNEKVEIIDKSGNGETIYGQTAYWYKVDYNGTTGWLWNEYLQMQ
ncbi:NERD domain-containing protein [Solitalea longa]|uniref:NERD domain-containing protein n=1 Tax=Solitalea longa TaxID=2079460 RepID=UPI0013FE1647|nr:NERD domain-containing protein [Solitalea longa]